MITIENLVKTLKTSNVKRTISVDIAKLISDQLGLKPSIIRKGIEQHRLFINDKPVHKTDIEVREGLEVKFMNTLITLPVIKEYSFFDKVIEKILETLNVKDIRNIPSQLLPSFCSYIVGFFSLESIDSIDFSDSIFQEITFSKLEGHYKDYFKDNKETRIPRRKELVEFFTKSKTDAERQITAITKNLSEGAYDQNLYKFLQEYTKIVDGNIFKHCIAPLFKSSVYTRASVTALLKMVSAAASISDIEEKFKHFETSKGSFDNFKSTLSLEAAIDKRNYYTIANHLFNLLKKQCDTVDIKKADLSFKAAQRKYNFLHADREHFDLSISVTNNGEGFARELNIVPSDVNFTFPKMKIGSVKPGETIYITLKARIKPNPDFVPSLKFVYEWLDVSSNLNTNNLTIKFQQQDANVPWEEIDKTKPYTIQEIDDPQKLYGRDQILAELEHNVLSSNIESYKIWGQKRVGKSSIVRTLWSILRKYENVIAIWRPIGGIKNRDPEKTLNTLGDSICSLIYEDITNKIKNPGMLDLLRSVPLPVFDGSLFPLEEYIKKLKRYNNDLKFLFILDEFDNINEEFFLPNSLGNTLSLNIGKGLNQSNYIGFILVGSENMHLLNFQETNYNSFLVKEVDTFNRMSEFQSFSKIVTEPVSPHIHYQTTVVERIYDVTNGNPYFANLICKEIFKAALRNRDAEVDIVLANEIISTIVSSTQKEHFVHFWSDGITEESSIKKEKKTDIRRRILVSYSFVFLQQKQFPTRQEIVKAFNRPLDYDIRQHEIENTIKEFFNRKIFSEDESMKIRIKPTLFENWLCGPGRTLMIEGISDLEALQRERELEEEWALKDDEYKRLIYNFKFKGSQLQKKYVEEYFKQFGNSIEQRRAFSLIDKITYLSNDEINQFFLKEQKNIFEPDDLELKSGAKTVVREGVEIYCLPGKQNEYEEICDSFKRMTHIRHSKSLKDLSSQPEAWKTNKAQEIVILCPIIIDFADIREHLDKFLNNQVVEVKIPCKIVCLFITTQAKSEIIKYSSAIPNLKLISLKEVDANKITPFSETQELFETAEEASYSILEVKKHFPTFRRDSILVLFEVLCPSESLPILWCKTSQFQPLFSNPHGQIKQENDDNNDGEKRRLEIYQANTELSQKLNAYIIDFLKRKAGILQLDNWFRVELIPKSVLKGVSEKHISDDQKSEIQTYFDFLDYHKIIEKHSELQAVFKLKSEGLAWLSKLNDLRRDPAHPEKPAPDKTNVQYFKKVKEEMVLRMQIVAPVGASPIIS